MIGIDFIEKIKLNEGNIKYQQTKGFFKNNKFYVYKDSRGFPTIGYGHLCTASEVKKYSNGITVIEADNLLAKDISIAMQGAARLFQMNRHSVRVQHVLIEMVFQLGETKAALFKKFKANLDALNYKGAAMELVNSAWYTQTKSRVQGHIDI